MGRDLPAGRRGVGGDLPPLSRGGRRPARGGRRLVGLYAPAGQAETPGPMIRLERVTRTVTSGTEQLTILDAVDLFVPAGQFIAVTGPSGSGKSTMLSLV